MKITRALLQSLTFRPFTQNDYFGFSGVTSPVPMISDNTEILVIIDGCYCELYANLNDNGEADDVCEDIRELPFMSDREIQIRADIANMEKSLASLKAELDLL